MRFFIKRVDRMAKIGYDNRNDTFKARDGGNRVKRIMLIVSYDGTAYHGWQVQPSAITIEGVLNETISRLTGEVVQVIGASRTDAGVHALGNVAVFDTNSGGKVFLCVKPEVARRYCNTVFKRGGGRFSSTPL